MTEPKQEIVLYLSAEQDQVAGCNWTIRLAPQALSLDGKSLTGLWSDDKLDDFVIMAYLSHASGKPETYVLNHWAAVYERPYRVNAERASVMAKVLGRIQLRLDQVKHQAGQPTTFAHYALRVARILGITHYVIRGERRADDQLNPRSIEYLPDHLEPYLQRALGLEHA